jgi:hypothetical protein
MALRLNGSSSGYVELDVPAAAGSHTLTLPDGGGSSGQYLQTNGSGGLSWVTLPDSGKILQVQQTFKRDTASQLFTATNTYQDISGMSVNITPVAANSNILVMFDIYVQANTGTIHIRLARGADDTIAIGDAGGASQLRDTAMSRPAVTPYALDQNNLSQTFLDDPTYTLGDTLTYKLRWTLGSSYTNTIYMNRSSSNTNADYDPRPTSSITVMEIAA